jgi:HlyD family secretion protein
MSHRLNRFHPLVLPLVLGYGLAACTASDEGTAMSGYAEAELVYLAPSAAGMLETLAVRRGDEVRQGQVLYTLDTGAEVPARDAALARSQQAQAQAADLGKGRRPLELRQFEQQLAQAEATLAASTATLERNRRLVEQGFVAALQLDALVAARDRDAARVKELQAQRAFAAEAARQDTITAAAAAARGAQADLALAQWREAQKQRSAPADAQVFDVFYRVGEWVAAGTPVLALLPPAALKVRFFVAESELPQARIGREVRLACDGCPAALSARIRWVSPQAEFTPPVIYSIGTRSKLVFMVEATPAPGSALKPGQPLDVRFGPAP